MSKPLFINADAGAPEYTAADLRRAMAALLAQDVADRLGARSGVRPGPPVVSLSGTTVTVHHHAGQLYPGLTPTAGPYLYAFTEATHPLNPADGSNPRIDAIDIQVQDDDEDASGERRVRSVYVVGTPAASPDEPALTATSERFATVLVPAGGSPAPSLTYVAPAAVAAGGILPVRDASELPSAGLYDGLLAFLQDIGQLWVSRAGQFGEYLPSTGLRLIERQKLETVGSFDDVAIPSWAREVEMRLSARRDFADKSVVSLLRINDDSGAGQYSSSGDFRKGAAAWDVEDRSSQPNGLAGWVPGNTALGGRFGNLTVNFADVQDTGKRTTWRFNSYVGDSLSNITEHVNASGGGIHNNLGAMQSVRIISAYESGSTLEVYGIL